MAAHVYILDKSEVNTLNKLLSYDPYLDPNLIPSTGYDDRKKETEEEKKKREELEAATRERLQKAKQEDKYFDVIFARQEYEIFDGSDVGLNPDKSYLYLKSNDEFLAKADEALEHKINGLKRADPDSEKKVIDKVMER
jgi:hypothetical protein